jgi:hypothetical protein
MRTKFDIKIIWNHMFRDKKNQLENGNKKQTSIKYIKFDIKIKWNQMMSDEIKEKLNKK